MSYEQNHVSLARKYRPQNFTGLIGQDCLAKALSYSIANKKLHSSFLLSGIRGVGKTTSARIVAQTLNCSTPQTLENGLVVPCGVCKSCVACLEQSHPDILELDAASYTSVDHIREIVGNVSYMPILASHKVFIIDEAHMLSKSAFNALLKTLEEPPSNVVFMLLTTEPSKIPITVVSRCQRFNLSRLGAKDLCDLLQRVCGNENINCAADLLTLIAAKADGSARDALTILDQAWTLSLRDSQGLTKASLEEILDLHYIANAASFLAAILQQDAAKALQLTKKLYEQNVDFSSIINAILELLAYLLKKQFVPDIEAGIYASYEKELAPLISASDAGQLSFLWQIFYQWTGEDNINQLMHFEMLLLKSLYCQMLPKITNYDQTKVAVPKMVTASKTAQQIEKQKPEVSPTNISIEKPAHADSEVQQLQNPAKDEVCDENLTSFLTYLYKNSLFDVYHFFMHQCSVTNFAGNVLKVRTSTSNAALQDKLLAALKGWNSDWSINFSKVDKLTSLYQKLKNDFADEDVFRKLKECFDNASIKDIKISLD